MADPALFHCHQQVTGPGLSNKSVFSRWYVTRVGVQVPVFISSTSIFIAQPANKVLNLLAIGLSVVGTLAGV